MSGRINKRFDYCLNLAPIALDIPRQINQNSLDLLRSKVMKSTRRLLLLRHSHFVIFFLSTFLITFVFLHAHFAYVFAFFSLAAICILLDFSHNSALFNFIRKSFSKKLNIGVSESIRLTSISSL